MLDCAISDIKKSEHISNVNTFFIVLVLKLRSIQNYYVFILVATINVSKHTTDVTFIKKV